MLPWNHQSLTHMLARFACEKEHAKMRIQNAEIKLLYGSKSHAPSEHPNPTTKTGNLKWVVNSPTNQNGINHNGFDNHCHQKRKRKKADPFRSPTPRAAQLQLRCGALDQPSDDLHLTSAERPCYLPLHPFGSGLWEMESTSVIQSRE